MSYNKVVLDLFDRHVRQTDGLVVNNDGHDYYDDNHLASGDE